MRAISVAISMPGDAEDTPPISARTGHSGNVRRVASRAIGAKPGAPASRP